VPFPSCEAPSTPAGFSLGQLAAPEHEQQRAEGGRTGRHYHLWSTVSTAPGLFVLAVAVRWWGLPAQARAMWGDEAQLLIEARKFIQGVYTTPFIVDGLSLPALYEYVLSFPLRLAGSVDVTVARGVSGVLGALSTPLLYLTARELGYPRRVGFVAGVALATTFWDVSFSRLVLQNIMAATAASVTILCMVMAVRRSNVILAALAGLGLAWAFNAYLSGTMVGPLVAGWLGLLIVWHSHWWKRYVRRPARSLEAETERTSIAAVAVASHKHVTFALPSGNRVHLLDLNSTEARPWRMGVLAVAGVLGVTAVICAWPVLQLYLAPGSFLSAHMLERYILAPANRAAFAAAHPDIGSGTVGILWYQFKAMAGMFTVKGEPEPIFNLPGRPMLDAISGILFLLGLARALWSWRRPNATLILAWLAVPLIMGTMLTTGMFGSAGVPSSTRSLPAIPAMCLLIALGLETVLLALHSILRQAVRRLGARAGLQAWWPALRLGIVALTAVTIGVLGIQRYWDFANAPVTRQAFYNSAHEWALFLAPRGAMAVTVVGPYGWPGEYPVLYAPAARICAGRWYSAWSRCPPARIIIFDNDSLDAYRYAAVAHVPSHVGQSDDKTLRYWYAEGQHLPDPARVIAGLR
jgi:Dolichyl-phosphate-mannose-protein mannosyltransferase